MIDIHAIHAAAYSVAVDGDAFRFRDCNSAALALTDLCSTFQPGLTPQDIFPPDVANRIVERYRACCAGGAVTYETTTTVGDESRRWQTTLVSTAGPDGSPTMIYGICSRATAAGSADMSSLALEALDGGFWTLDLATRDFKTSRRLAEKLAGPGHVTLNLAEYVGYIHADDLKLDLPNGEDEVTVELRVFTFEARMRWLQTCRRLICDASGRPTHVVGVVLDITERKLATMRLEEEAATDILTHVGNRRAFDQAAERCFGNEAGGRFGVLVVDLDDFKPVNDRYGHRVGDDLLREVGHRLAQHVSAGDLLARIGGDEFAVLMPATTPERIRALAETIEASFFEPFVIGNVEISVGASCGVAIRSGEDRSVGDIVARADRALYAAKHRRRLLTA